MGGVSIIFAVVNLALIAIVIPSLLASTLAVLLAFGVGVFFVMRGAFAAKGITRQPYDMLIAATALLHKIPLATRNTTDFEGCGILLINPFLGGSDR